MGIKIEPTKKISDQTDTKLDATKTYSELIFLFRLKYTKHIYIYLI